MARQDSELVSIYRDIPQSAVHVNPVFVGGLRKVYDKGVEDGYEQARQEFEGRSQYETDWAE